MPIQLTEAVSSITRGSVKDMIRKFLTGQKKDIVFSSVEVVGAVGISKDSLFKYRPSLTDLHFRPASSQSIMWGHPDAIKKLKEIYAKQAG